MFIAPIHEALDTKFLRLEEKPFSKENVIRRFFLRALVFGVNTFIIALFPFMGDFVHLFGSFTLFPLTFVFPSMVFIKVKISKLSSCLFVEFNRQNHVVIYLLHCHRSKERLLEEGKRHGTGPVLASSLYCQQ